MFCDVVRLVREVEIDTVTLKDEKGEKSVINNRVAISDGRDMTTFIDITAWGGTAELIAKHFKKGDELYIEGVLRNKDIKIKDSEKTIQVAYIVVKRIKFTFGRKTGDVDVCEEWPEGDIADDYELPEEDIDA